MPIVLDKIPDTTGCYVYILRCNNDALYTGWTTNITQRFYKHAIGKGAKYTRAHRPLELFYMEACESRSAAQKREAEIKRYTRKEKLALKEAVNNHTR